MILVRMLTIACSLLLWANVAAAQTSNAPPDDPLSSVQWQTMHKLFLADHPVVFDDRVRVIAPDSAEDSLAVPVFVDASGLPNADAIEKIVVFADFNPIPKVLEFYPKKTAPKIGFRFKIQQASPIRAAVLDREGTWYVGGTWIDAAGGGCTLPSIGSGDEQWSSRLGELHARLWPGDTSRDSQRLKFSVVHPMDTGLAAGIPAFYVETITLKDVTGQELATLHPFEPVSENPVFAGTA